MVLEELDLLAVGQQAAAELRGHPEGQIEALQPHLHVQKLVAHYSLEQKVDLLVDPLDQSQKEQKQRLDVRLVVQLVS